MRLRLFLLFILVVPIMAFANKPKWVGNTPTELNNTYKFVEVISYGSSMKIARENAKQILAQNQQLLNAVTMNVDTGILTKVNQQMVNGNMREVINTEVEITIKETGKSFKLQAGIVDEYVAGYERGGEIKLHTLYMVAVTDDPVFDRTYTTTSYGAGAAAMSIIPGLGQFYKGSYLKGGLMMAGTAAGIVGIILCENQRADYKSKMKQQAQFAKDYNTKANNWETARNVAIGVTAAIYIYNLIDAAAAKGARRVIVKKANGNNVSFYPVATPYSAGVALTYNF